MATKKTAKKAARKKTATKKPAAAKRVVPKKSPHAGSSVEHWIAKKAKGWQADAIRAIVRLVAKVAPKSAAAIKWGQPVFDHNGPFAYVRPSSKHLTFGFWRGAELAGGKGKLEGDGMRMRHLKIPSLAHLDEKLAALLIRQAVKLNRGKGDPTRR